MTVSQDSDTESVDTKTKLVANKLFSAGKDTPSGKYSFSKMKVQVIELLSLFKKSATNEWSCCSQ